MDPHAQPIPAGGPLRHPPKLKLNRKAPESVKTISKEPLVSRQKRVFGTARSTNIPIKSINEKPVLKSLIGVLPKQSKSIRGTESSIGTTTNATIEAVAKKSPANPIPRLKRNSEGAKEQVAEKAEKKSLRDDNVVEPKTPVALPSLLKVKNSGTPYYSAEKCSKCRFDKLETSSYWLGQVKLAESVGKHFVSAAFFRLAFESNAEPFRNLRVELKRYLSRHEYLSTHTEWKDVCLSYGLPKGNSKLVEQSLCTGKAEMVGNPSSEIGVDKKPEILEIKALDQQAQKV